MGGIEISWTIIAPLLLIQAILTMIALFDLIKAENTKGPKYLWMFIIIFVATIGPIIYFLIGRRD